MKRTFLFSLLAWATTLFTACEKDSGTDSKEIEIAPYSMTLSASGETQTVTVTAAGSWTAQSNADWCTLSAISGTGNATVEVTAGPNATGSARSAIVMFRGSANASPLHLDVYQKSNAISLSVDTIRYAPAGGGAYFRVTAHEKWTAACDREWFSISPEEGDGGDGTVNVRVTVTRNSNAEPRLGHITLTTLSGQKATVTVSQAKGTPVGELGLSCAGFLFESSPSPMEILLFAQPYTFQVTAPAQTSQWEVACTYPEGTEPFLNFSGIYSRLGSGEFTMTPATNLHPEERRATVTVNSTTDERKDSWRIDVVQLGCVIATTPATIEPLDEKEQRVALTVKVEPQMELLYAADVDWIRPVEGEPGVWNVAANAGSEQREGNLLVKLADDESLTAAVVPIVQHAGLQPSDLTLEIPFQCNVYVTPVNPTLRTIPSCHSSIIRNGGSSDTEAGKMYTNGWRTNYDSQGAQLSFFFRTELTGELDLGLTASMGVASSEAVVNVSIGDVSYDVRVYGTTKRVYPAGRFRIDKPGYVRVDIKGVSSTCAYYPTIEAFNVGGAAVGHATRKTANLTYVTAAQMASNAGHFVRRGPSCHLSWTQPSGNTEYFYNEIVVPEGEDIDGAYFMTTGFSGGYMGLQPNASGRVVLFSVWDTDTEADLLGEVVRHGTDVTPNRFGHEGSGWQTFKRYEWKAETKYATLVHIRPDPENSGSSLYTGYFWSEERGWELLAEIRCPRQTTYYRGAYSFSENFKPEAGWLTRRVTFTNQWMRTTDGQWHEITNARVTVDGTGSDGLRKDFYGGVDEAGNFYLRNIGYFDETIRPGTAFSRPSTGHPSPVIDFEALSRLGVKK